MAWHKKTNTAGTTEEERRLKVASMVAVLNVPCRQFNHPVLKDLFSRAKLGPVNESIARRYTAEEVK